MSQCSFCRRAIGEGRSEYLLRTLASLPKSFHDDVREHIRESFKAEPDRKIRLLMPGPGDIQICDICIELYADASRRELAAHQ